MKKFLIRMLMMICLCTGPLFAAQQVENSVPETKESLEEKIAERDARIQKILSSDSDLSRQDMKTISALREENRIDKRKLRQMKTAERAAAAEAALPQKAKANNVGKSAGAAGEQNSGKSGGSSDENDDDSSASGKDSVWNHIFPF